MNQDSPIVSEKDKSITKPNWEEPEGTRITMYERCKETGTLLRVIYHKQTIRHLSDLEAGNKKDEEGVYD